MDGKALITILVSLLAGAAGGVGAHWVAGQTKAGGLAATDDNTAVLEALQRIESRLDASGRTGLRGSAPTNAERSGGSNDPLGAMAADESEDGPMARLLARIDETVSASMQKKFEEMEESGEGLSMSIGGNSKPKKAVSFDELSRELELTADEEAKLREALKATEDAALKLLVDEGQDVEDLRRELKEKMRTPEGKAEMRGKLMTKAMSNIGGFIGLMITHQGNVAGAIGATKASKLESGFRITDPDFIDFDAFEMD